VLRNQVLTVSQSRPRQSWQALVAIFGVTALVEGLSVSQILTFMPLYLRQLGVGPADVGRWVGLLSSLVFLVGLPLVPFWGVWADRLGRRPVIARSALVEALVLLLVGLARTPWQLAGALLLVGFQLGNTGIMLAAIRDAAPEGRVGLATALLGMGGALGFAIGPAAGGQLVDAGVLSLRGLYFTASALSVGTTLLIFLGYRERFQPGLRKGSAGRQALAALSGVWRHRVTRRLFIIFTLTILGSQMTMPYFPLVVQLRHPQVIGLAGAIGVVSGAAALVGALLTPAAGALGDRIGFPRMLAAAALAVAVSLVVFPFLPTVTALTAVAVLFGAGRSAAQAMLFALLATRTPREGRAATLNLVYVPLYLGGLVGPALAAAIVGLGLAPIFLVGAAAYVLALLLTLRRTGDAANGQASGERSGTSPGE
jgi:MFS transporter, DHA1 family, multidrug resistance protein